MQVYVSQFRFFFSELYIYVYISLNCESVRNFFFYPPSYNPKKCAVIIFLVKCDGNVNLEDRIYKKSQFMAVLN